MLLLPYGDSDHVRDRCNVGAGRVFITFLSAKRERCWRLGSFFCVRFVFRKKVHFFAFVQGFLKTIGV